MNAWCLRTLHASTILLLLTVAHAGAGCRSASRAQVMVRTELCFGLSRPDAGADVTAEQFRQFVDEQITPRFPAGLTIIPAEGQWRQRDGVIAREDSRIVVILHESGFENDRKIEQIREAYRQRFQQEAVMRVDDRERVRF